MSPLDRKAVEPDVESTRYLIFSLAGEPYATPLASVREVLKLASIKDVPFAAPFFKGVLNLRGQILSVLDVREKLGMPVQKAAEGLLLVVERDGDCVVGIVDDVLAVATLQVEKTPPLESRIPLDFILGMARWGQTLVSVIDIVRALSPDDLAAARRAAA